MVYAPKVPSLRQIAIVFGITGFQRICLTLTPSQLDRDTFDIIHITFYGMELFLMGNYIRTTQKNMIRAGFKGTKFNNESLEFYASYKLQEKNYKNVENTNFHWAHTHQPHTLMIRKCQNNCSN